VREGDTGKIAHGFASRGNHNLVLELKGLIPRGSKVNLRCVCEREVGRDADLVGFGGVEVLGISSSLLSSGLECLVLQSCSSITKQKKYRLLLSRQ
jgi:hypothetical protein